LLERLKLRSVKKKEDKGKEDRRIERLKKEEQRKQRKKEKKEKKRKGRSPRNRSKSPKRKSPKLSSWESEEQKWILDVIKNGSKVESIHLVPDMTYSLGRDADIKLEHASCSKNHAKISFMNNNPHIMDLNSTNGTVLNQEELTAGQWYKLSEKDTLKFGCSTREYIVKCVTE